VLTKLDAVLSSPHAARAERDFDVLINSLRRIFGRLFGAIDSFKVAALAESRPKSSNAAMGCTKLLMFWTQPADRVTPRAAAGCFAASRVRPPDCGRGVTTWRIARS